MPGFAYGSLVLDLVAVPGLLWRRTRVATIGLLLLLFQPPGVECSRVRRYGSINNDSVLTGHVAYFTRRALLAMIQAAGFAIRDVRQVGQRSGWMKLQEAQGKSVSLLVRMIWWIYAALSLKKEYLIVIASKASASR